MKPKEEGQFVSYQGVRVVKGWPERIQAAQLQTAYSIGGKLRPRIRYDEKQDWWEDGQQPCHDCAVLKTQFHVPNCAVEQCPNCGGQVIGCGCSYDDAECIGSIQGFQFRRVNVG
jgi:hypothetical protein